MTAIPAAKSVTAYDLVPYESRPFAFAQPGRIGAIAELFGLEVAPPEEARYLEIGCGLGDNILPLAARFSKASFVGIDLSAVQIERATRLKNAMGLENVSLRRVGVADVDPSFGTFDYIVCHGVYSWVDARTREAILRACGERLSPKGIALVSYNALPGWRQVEALREMMQFHVSGLTDPRERIEQAKSLMRFLIEGTPESNPAYRQFLEGELRMIEALPPSYLLHDHLGAENKAFYLHEIVLAARRHGMEYFADVHPEIAYPNSFPDRIRATLLGGIDPVQIEQYIDYLTNRRFRHSLFTKGRRLVNRSLQSSQIFSFHIESTFPPVDPASIELVDDVPRAFETPAGIKVNAGDRYCSALMVVLSNLSGRTIRANELLAEAKRLLGSDGDSTDADSRLRSALHEIGIELVLRGALRISLTPITVGPLPPTRPRALSPAAEFVAANRSTFWSDRHEIVSLDTVDAAFLSWCDGTRDLDALTDKLSDALAAGTISMSSDAAEDPAARRARLKAWAQARVASFHGAGLFRA